MCERLFGSGGSGLKIDTQLAAVLAECGDHAAARFALRRPTLRLRRQRLSGQPDPATIAAPTAMAAQVASPFNLCQAELELARQAPPVQALPILLAWRDDAVSRERPGLQLHATTLAACAAHALDDQAQARALTGAAAALAQHCAPLDMTRQEVATVQRLLQSRA